MSKYKIGDRIRFKGEKHIHKIMDYNELENNYTTLLEGIGATVIIPDYQTEHTELVPNYEPDHFADDGKMAEKIEELEDSDVLNLPYRTIKFSMDERTIQMYFSEVVRRMKMHEDKLNEVINKVNAQTTVLLTQNDKDYDEAVKILKNN